MMSNLKQQFTSNFLSNDLDSNFVRSDSTSSNSTRSNSARLRGKVVSSSLLDGVAIFPDGSVTWVPDNEAIGDGTRPDKTAQPFANHLPYQSYPQNRNYRPSSAVALIKRLVKRQVLSFRRVLL